MRSQDIEYLIELVKLRPTLWRSTDPYYHDTQFKKSLWNEVALLTNSTEEAVRSEWYSVKSVFKRELVHVLPLLQDKPPDEINSPWPFFRNMLFLRDEFKHLTGAPAVPRPASPEHTSFIVLDGDTIEITETTHDAFVTEFHYEVQSKKKTSEPASSRENLVKDTCGKRNVKKRQRRKEAPAREVSAPTLVTEVVEILSDDSEIEEPPHLEPAILVDPPEKEEESPPMLAPSITTTNTATTTTTTTTTNHHQSRNMECEEEVDPIEEVRRLVRRTDPLVGFFASLLPHLKTVPRQKKERLKQRIEQLVMGAADSSKLSSNVRRLSIQDHPAEKRTRVDSTSSHGAT